MVLLKRKQKRLLTLEEKERDRKRGCVFAFIIICIGMFGYMYECYTYHPYNSIVPNFANIISESILRYKIIPEDAPMFMPDYYIHPYKNESLSDYMHRVPSDLRLENKVWSGWLYMIFMFTPLFIITVLGLKVDKIDKKKIKEIKDIIIYKLHDHK